jgi:hypothetical protein
MQARLIPMLAVAVALALATTAWTADRDVKGETHEGVVVSAGDGKLVMSDKEGQNKHEHLIGADTAISLDGKAAELADLKAGMSVVVTTDADNNVTKVAATSVTQ